MQLQRFIDKWEPVMGVKSAGFTIKKMKTRWGSCNVKSHHLNFNLLLAEGAVGVRRVCGGSRAYTSA